MRTIACNIHGQLKGPYAEEMTRVSLEFAQKNCNCQNVMSPACVLIPLPFPAFGILLMIPTYWWYLNSCRGWVS